MKQPFWILNSILLFIFVSSLLFIFYSRIKIPKRQSIEAYQIPVEKKDEKINSEIIYKNDLFSTYYPEIILPEISVQEKIPMPPQPIEPRVPEISVPHFLDPLDITLTGIIIQEDENQNKAIILDNKTKNQINYNVGDEIEDAQLIRILRNKIILIRSNGQQEILYLREEDLKEDSPIDISSEFKNIVRKMDEYDYIVDPFKFAYYVRNLGEFLDIFDLSTAFKNGAAIGSKIVKLNPESIAVQMGFLPGDIIIRINDIETNNNDSRFEIYKNITSSKENDVIKVDILRNNLPLTNIYKLKRIEKIKTNEDKTEFNKLEKSRIEDEKIKIMKEKYQFAPTIDEIAAIERQNLFKRKK